jgi:2-hydroxychromene-2-carboxylate isomerase
MQKSVEFLYDFASVPCYIAWKHLDGVAAETGARVTMTPVLCQGIFNAIGNPGPLAVPAKREWYGRDLELWAKKRNVPYRPNPHSPIRSLPLLRGVFVAEERGESDRYIQTVFEAIFVHCRNMSDMETVKAAFAEAGLDSGSYLREIERDDIKAKLRRNTDQAVARGVFGVPTFFVGEELFFGQDRLEFVRDALAAP